VSALLTMAELRNAAFYLYRAQNLSVEEVATLVGATEEIVARFRRIADEELASLRPRSRTRLQHVYLTSSQKVGSHGHRRMDRRASSGGTAALRHGPCQ
jgi:hypothetical protein